MEINQSATELLLKGTVADGLPDWDQGRPQPVKYIDFENSANNDFLVINQFKVELTSGRGHVIPDAVLFVNGIPLVVAEFKSPGIENPLQEAINQLLRYSNQRRELFPTLYTDNEGVERLFHTNQLLIASDFFEARAATIGAPPEAYLEWADTSPVPMSTVAEELGVLSSSLEEAEAEQELAVLGPEQTERAGTPLFFRKPEQRPAAMRNNGASSAQPADSRRRHAAPGAPARLDAQLHRLSAGGRQDAQGGGALSAVPRDPQSRGTTPGRPHTPARSGSRRARRDHLAHARFRQESQHGVPRAQDAHDAAPKPLQGRCGYRPHRSGRPVARDGATLRRSAAAHRSRYQDPRIADGPDAAHSSRNDAGHRLRDAAEVSGRGKAGCTATRSR